MEKLLRIGSDSINKSRKKNKIIRFKNEFENSKISLNYIGIIVGNNDEIKTEIIITTNKCFV